MKRGFWERYRQARKKQKPKLDGVPRDGWISRLINRRISALVTAGLAERDVRPNQVSCFVFLLGVLTCVPLFLMHHFFLAGIAVWIISILDGVDGELARLKKLGSPFGAFLDSFLDRLYDSSLIFAIALAMNSFSAWVFAFIGFFGMFLDYYTVELVGNKLGKGRMDKAQVKIVKKTKFWPARDIFLFLISIFSFLSIPHYGLFLAGLLSCIFSLARLGLALKS